VRRLPLVLVPGACLGGWAWAEVAALLRDRGHDVHPVTLTGFGDRAHLVGPQVGLATHVEDVVAVLEMEDLRDAVLVGHSYSGIVVTGAAAARPGRLDAVAYLDTGPIPDGMAIADVQSAEARDGQRAECVERNGGLVWPVPSRERIATGAYGSAAGLNDEHYRRFSERGTAQPYATLTDPLRLEGPWPPPGVRRAAVFCADGGMSVAQVRALVGQGDPRAALFADPDWELHDLPTGHWAMFTDPAATAGALSEIATRPS
jgi:pimeloyl-ACP methyl ester carboxylesterase